MVHLAVNVSAERITADELNSQAAGCLRGWATCKHLAERAEK